MSSLTTILKAAEADLNKLAGWIDASLKLLGPSVALVDPPLGPVISAVEVIVQDLQASTSTPVSAASIQQITQAVTTLVAMKVSAASVTAAFSKN